MQTIPKDPVMLLSFVNTQLRDHYSSFEAFTEAYEADGSLIKEKLSAIDYVYDKELNQFV